MLSLEVREHKIYYYFIPFFITYVTRNISNTVSTLTFRFKLEIQLCYVKRFSFLFNILKGPAVFFRNLSNPLFRGVFSFPDYSWKRSDNRNPFLYEFIMMLRNRFGCFYCAPCERKVENNLQ